MPVLDVGERGFFKSLDSHLAFKPNSHINHSISLSHIERKVYVYRVLIHLGVEMPIAVDTLTLEQNENTSPVRAFPGGQALEGEDEEKGRDCIGGVEPGAG